MKTLALSFTVTILLVTQAFAQNKNQTFDFRVYSVPTRPVYFTHLKEESKMLYVDYREGLRIDCEQAKLVTYEEEDRSINYTPNWFEKNWLNLDSIPIDMAYIPEGQNLDNWEEMIRIWRLDTSGGPEPLYLKLKETREENCPGKSRFEVVETGKKRILYISSTEDCEEFDAETAMVTIIAPLKLVFNQHTLWIIEYEIKGANRDSMFTEEIRNWFRNIEVVSGKELKALVNPE